MMRKYRSDLLISLGLVAAVMAVYLQAVTFGLVHVEDIILYNEYRARLNATGFPLLGIFHMPSNAVYMVPVSNFIGFLDTWLCGDDIGLLHLMNVAIHAINSVLLFLVLRLASGCIWRSAFAAALFALHPINTEDVVSWCRGPALIVSFFFLITFLFYLYYARQPSLKRYSLVFCSLLLGMLSKPSIVYLPFTLLLFDFWPLQRWGGAAATPNGKRDFSTALLRNLIVEKLPLFGILGGWAAASMFVLHLEPPFLVKGPPADNLLYLFNIPVSYICYIWQMLFPLKLPLYFPGSLEPASIRPLWEIIAALIALAATTTAVIYYRKKHPFLITGWFWFLVSLAPYAFFCAVLQRPVIARFAYLPMIGMAIIAAWGGGALLTKLKCHRWLIATLALGLLAVCMVMSWIKAGHWSDKISYFSHSVQIRPECERTRSNFGEILYNKGFVEEAISQFETALRINPDFFVAHNHLGMILSGRGDRRQAFVHLRKAVELAPDDVQAHNNLANLLVDMGRIDEAIVHYKKALQIKPSLFRVHNNFATALVRKGEYKEAVSHLKKALSINPGYQIARDNLARVKDMIKDK